jgi:hypothetical protein
MYDDLTLVAVTDKAVLFNGVELPGIISRNGVSFKPGGYDDLNRLTVEFLVGPVVFTDPSIESSVRCGPTDDSESRWNTLAFWAFSEWRMEAHRIDDLMKEYL